MINRRKVYACLPPDHVHILENLAVRSCLKNEYCCTGIFRKSAGNNAARGSTPEPGLLSASFGDARKPRRLETVSSEEANLSWHGTPTRK